MTIIQPKEKSRLNILIILLSLFCASVIWWMVSVYNSTVDLSHNITVLEVRIQKGEVASAELKNELYSALDPIKLEEMAKAKGLVKDKDPQYLEANYNVSWQFASQY